MWQLPPNLAFHPDKLEAFLAALPGTGRKAAAAGRHHDHRLKASPYLKYNGIQTIRHAMEVRHPSFVCPQYLALLRKYHVASVVSDSAQRFPVINDVTADFVYVRLHGHKELYTGGYPSRLLKTWGARIQNWAEGYGDHDQMLTDRDYVLPRKPRDVFVFFDNDAKVDAPKDAIKLRHLVRQHTPKR